MLAELKLYAVCFVTIILVDLVWIGIVMQKFYVEQLRPIGRIVGDKFAVMIWPAAVVYVALSIGIVQFALPKVGTDSSWLMTFATGALLGFVIYATYDFTNLSTLKDWTLPMTFVDTAWGAVLGGIATSVARFVRDL